MGRKVVETNDLVFVDLSHYVFQRYYAIQRWCKFSGKTFETDEEMLEMFSRMFETSLVAMKKKLKFAWKNLYLIQDCPRENIWRMKLYPDYKQNRLDKSETGFNPIVFVETYKTIAPRMIKDYGIHMYGYDGAEADDVIAILHGHIRATQPDQGVIVITNDNDYLQLKDHATTLLNSNLKDISERYDQDTLDHFGLWKAIRGDDSDNIPAIDKKIGDKVALRLALNPELLQERLAGNAQVRAQFELNQTLIMFERIPSAIKEGVIEAWKK